MPTGTVVQYEFGDYVTRGIVCRPSHLDGAVVFTPGGYSGLTGDDRYWSVVEDASYRFEAIKAERKFGRQYQCPKCGGPVLGPGPCPEDTQ